MSRKAVLWAAVGAGVVLVGLVAGTLLGLRLFAVMSPSMGQTAPVGTLVVTQPASAYRVGDVVSFARGERIYTHRIVDVRVDGSYTTAGDLNAVADPLPVAPGEVIGTAVWIAAGLGWVLLGLPWLILGALLVYLLSLIAGPSRQWRWALRISGWAVVACLVAVWLRPWINLQMLGFTPADGGGVMMHVVNTGLFPLDANRTLLLSGQDAVIHITERNPAGYYTLTPRPALAPIQHVVMLLVCLIPLASAFLVPPDASPAADSTVSRPRRHRIASIAIVVAVIAAVAIINTTSSLAAFAATIRDTNDTTGSRTFFTCRNAETRLGAGSTYLVYALGTARSTTSNEADLTGNGRSGRYLATSTTSTSVGCTRDTPASSVTFNGTSQCLYINANYATSGYFPNTFSLEAWFKTSTKSNGKIIGFGNSRNTAADGNYDRHIYLDKDGRIVFGAYPGAVRIVYTVAGTNYADNSWHHVVATLSAAGQRLYVDGALAMSKTNVTTAEAIHGYWKVGCGTLVGWRNAATDAAGGTANDYSGPSYFTGQIQYAAVYNTALTAIQAREHYLAGAP